LKTTNMGTIIPGVATSPEFNKKFVKTAIEMLRNQEELAEKAKALQIKAKERFGLNRILEEWDEVFDG